MLLHCFKFEIELLVGLQNIFLLALNFTGMKLNAFSIDLQLSCQ